MEHFQVPCVVYRGGTSRGLFFHKKDLPDDVSLMEHIFLSGVGSADVSHIDGLGSGTSHTAKCVIVSSSEKEGADVNYTFYQVGIGEEAVDGKGTCGNLSGAVAAFAVDEGLVQTSDDSFTLVTVYNTNTDSYLKVKVPIKNGKTKIKGNYFVPGVIKPGAKIEIDFMHPSGGSTGIILPKGKTNKVQIDEGVFPYTFIDVVNCYVFLPAEAIGLSGLESNASVQNDEKAMNIINGIRNQVTVDVGMAKDIQDAKYNSSAIPKIGYVTSPKDYTTTSNVSIKKEEYDILSRAVSMERVHRTYPGSGLMSLAAASFIEGTFPNQVIPNVSAVIERGVIRIGHPDGIAEIRCKLTEDHQDVEFVGFDRTARRIIKGELFVPVKD